MLSHQMASSLVVTSLHGQQSGDAEEHSLMQLDFVSLQKDAIAHATHGHQVRDVLPVQN